MPLERFELEKKTVKKGQEGRGEGVGIEVGVGVGINSRDSRSPMFGGVGKEKGDGGV